MVKRKVCKRCKVFVDGSECSICKNASFSTNWNGRLFFLDAKNSIIAEKMGVAHDGEFAIKVK